MKLTIVLDRYFPEITRSRFVYRARVIQEGKYGIDLLSGRYLSSEETARGAAIATLRRSGVTRDAEIEFVDTEQLVDVEGTKL